VDHLNVAESSVRNSQKEYLVAFCLNVGHCYRLQYVREQGEEAKKERSKARFNASVELLCLKWHVISQVGPATSLFEILLLEPSPPTAWAAFAGYKGLYTPHMSKIPNSP
jgi:hypothetical protein